MKRRFFSACLLVFVSTCVAQTKVKTVHIRVLNGRNGKPVKYADTATVVFPLSPYTTPVERKADKLGDLTLLAPTEGQLTLTVASHPGCQHIAKADRAQGPAKISLQNIFAAGAIEANGCKVRGTPPVAGELIVYVRPLHWWEGFRD